MKKNKVLSLLLVLCILAAASMPASASVSRYSTNDYCRTDQEVELTRDALDPNGGYYVEREAQFAAKGLTMTDVMDLQSLGFSYNEILAMSRARLDSLLPSRAQREAANLLRRRASVYVINVAGSYNRNFHEDSEMVAGDWYSDNDGQYKEDQVESFAEGAYGQSGAKTAYHFFGEVTGYGTHQGVDMNLRTGVTVYSQHGGKVIAAGGTYGLVSIYNASDGVTYQYAHMQNIDVESGQTISAGTRLGYQSNVGAPGGSHLHFEVRSGSKTNMGPNDDNRINSLSPYDYM